MGLIAGVPIDRPYLELFAGAGGSALGFCRAGFRPLALVERDASAAATLRAAVEAGQLDGEVMQTDVDEHDFRPWRGRVFALGASPPCQPWSIAGQRGGVHDSRDGWAMTLQAIDVVAPVWFVAETVPGILHRAAGCQGDRVDCCGAHFWAGFVLAELRKRFATVDYRVLDAADFGVPQRRKRVFVVAGLHPFAWPRPWSAWRRASEVLQLDGQLMVTGQWRDGRPALVAPDPPGAITASYYKGAPWKRAGNLFVRGADGRDRPLTLAERAKLQGFPDAWPWQGSAMSRSIQIGNAVPPAITTAIGQAIIGAKNGLYDPV